MEPVSLPTTPRTSRTPTGFERGSNRARNLHRDVLRRSRSVSPPEDCFEDDTSTQNDDFGKEGIRVVARFRPSNDQELVEGGEEIVQFSDNFKTVRIKVPEKKDSDKKDRLDVKMREYEFSYDQIFPSDTSQEEVYRSAAEPVITAVLSGVNGAVVAYGQTGAGKTYTMQGPGFDDPRVFEAGLDETTKGIIPRLMEDLFLRLAQDVTFEYEVTASYVEIYNERLRDLLHDPKEPSRHLGLVMTADRGLYIPYVVSQRITSIADVMRLMRVGAVNQHVASTNSNEESSRSHGVFLVSVKKRDPVERVTKLAQLYLVDLAGSERLSKTGAQGQRFLELQNINKSLLALGNMIHALSTGQRARYRDSLLTRMLQNSFGGNSKTCLIISCSPNSWNAAETLSTLRFGDKTKAILNKPKVNQERSAAELLYLLEKSRQEVENQRSYISLLENDLRQLRQLNGHHGQPSAPQTAEQMEVVDLDPADAPSTTLSSAPLQLPPLPPLRPALAFSSPSVTPRAAPPPDSARRPLPHPTHPSARGAMLLEVDCLSFMCPISRAIMREPVFAMDGHTYERSEIERYLQANDNKSPITNVRLATQRTIPNFNMKRQLRVLGPALQRLFDDHSAMLPDEMLVHVFSFLTASQLCRAAQVCYNWWNCSQDSTVWLRLLEKDFSNYNEHHLKKRTEKQLYHKLYEKSRANARKAGSSLVWLQSVRYAPQGLSLVTNS
eukprot:TRINITY_DN5499_c0_g1_i2.p1 TRINITY_DN5499_c0_g1~~TRINITY_DN5499_c0_g1_i2.p1  ORF type:complete len:723 (-),score=120.34 TRINITY_DN5499_c0_g1_i2:170-2338(-)